ncbi:MAG: hypothetical protein FIA93_12235 [Deltaproteobacteria bacterium]|nr:hypothetical protein [Deltaproteobacteria bacterium]
MGTWRAAVVSLMLLAGTLVPGGPARGEVPPPAGLGELSAAERWVLERVAAGQVADLMEKFGAPEIGRRLRGRFLEALLTGEFRGLHAHRAGIYISQAVFTDAVSLEFAAVPDAVFLTDCRFQGPFNGANSHFRTVLAMRRTVFEQAANFHRLKVDADASFAETVFRGPADFGAAMLGGQFNLAGARFAGPGADFNGLEVRQGVSLRNAVFMKGVDFAGAAVGGEFNAAGARFAGPDGQAVFNGLKAARSVSFLNAAFAGPADFGSLEAGGDLVLDGARFDHPSRPAGFNGMKVAQNVSMEATVFRGPADFTMASIAGLLTLHRSRFEYKEAPAKFYNVKVEQHAFIAETRFAGGGSWLGSQFRHLMLAGSPAEPPGYPVVNLDGVIVEHSLVLGDIAIGSLQATRLKVKGPVIFKNVKIAGKADLRDSDLYSLKLIDVGWPSDPGEIWLEGLAYQSVSAGEGPEDWKRLLAWLDRSRLDSRNYNQLDTFFRRGGDIDRADQVYIAGHRRETLRQWWRPDKLATLIFWDGLAGYGRKPSRTVWIALMIVLVGTIFFDHENFDPSFVGGWKWLLDGGRVKKAVVRFFLSLDEFLPGLDLGLAKLWRMNRISFPTLLYYHFHKIAGWILIPIGLAAVYSQFR